MKKFLLLCFACLAVSSAFGHTYRTVNLYNQSYVLLREWADFRRFEVSYKDDAVHLRNRTNHLVFSANSQRATINGITVWLSYAIASKSGAAYIAQRDIENTLDPILFPPRARDRVKTIAISAGHGGKDPGFETGSLQEKQFTLMLARTVKTALTKAGFKVVMLRSGDEFIDRADRPAKAARMGGQLYLSLHYNAAPVEPGLIRGVESYCLTPIGTEPSNGNDAPIRREPGHQFLDANVQLAYQVQKALVKTLPATDRGVRRAGFVVLRQARMPAVLIEAGFMSHPAESRQIQSETYRRKTADAIVQAIKAYKAAVER